MKFYYSIDRVGDNVSISIDKNPINKKFTPFNIPYNGFYIVALDENVTTAKFVKNTLDPQKYGAKIYTEVNLNGPFNETADQYLRSPLSKRIKKIIYDNNFDLADELFVINFILGRPTYTLIIIPQE